VENPSVVTISMKKEFVDRRNARRRPPDRTRQREKGKKEKIKPKIEEYNLILFL